MYRWIRPSLLAALVTALAALVGSGKNWGP
jgi:hypothetical protein